MNIEKGHSFPKSLKPIEFFDLQSDSLKNHDGKRIQIQSACIKDAIISCHSMVCSARSCFSGFVDVCLHSRCVVQPTKPDFLDNILYNGTALYGGRERLWKLTTSRGVARVFLMWTPIEAGGWVALMPPMGPGSWWILCNSDANFRHSWAFFSAYFW